jgi:hypothetical protein
MLRRWIIRGLALALLTLCAVAWAGSSWRTMGTAWFGATARFDAWMVLSNDRAIFFLHPRLYCPIPNYWSWFSGLDENASAWDIEVAAQSLLERNRALGVSLMEFGFGQTNGFDAIPLWFPTLLSTLLLWFVWRKTRAKPAGGAFPVEPAKAGENQP